MSSTVASAINLSRAFSKRISHRDSHNPLVSFNIHRSSKRHSENMGIKKGLISGPVELISTTNSQVFSPAPVSTAVRASTSIEIPPSPELSSAGSPPPLTPDRDHHGLPTPPTTPVDKTFSNFRLHSRSGSAASNSTRHSGSSYLSKESNPPAVPQRKSSVSTASSAPSTPPPPPTQTQPSYSFFPPPPKSAARRLNKSFSSGNLKSHPATVHNVISMKPNNYSLAHPFRKELAQVSELAEELGLDLDEDAMIRRGLHKFSAEDYLAEVEDVIPVKGLFGRQPSVTLGGAGWI